MLFFHRVARECVGTMREPDGTSFRYPICIRLVGQYGIVGVATFWLLANIGYLALRIPLLHRRLPRGHVREWYVRDALPPFAIVTAEVLAVRQFLPLLSRDSIRPIDSRIDKPCHPYRNRNRDTCNSTNGNVAGRTTPVQISKVSADAARSAVHSAGADLIKPRSSNALFE